MLHDIIPVVRRQSYITGRRNCSSATEKTRYKKREYLQAFAWRGGLYSKHKNASFVENKGDFYE